MNYLTKFCYVFLGVKLKASFLQALNGVIFLSPQSRVWKVKVWNVLIVSFLCFKSFSEFQVSHTEYKLKPIIKYKVWDVLPGFLKVGKNIKEQCKALDNQSLNIRLIESPFSLFIRPFMSQEQN